MILFIHGFNSSPSPADINFLKKSFPYEEIYAPFIDYTDNDIFNTTISDIVNRCSTEKSDIVIVAKSLGCIVSQYLSWFSKGLMLINPAFGFMEELDKYKNEHFITNFRDQEKIHYVNETFLENIQEYSDAAPSLGKGYVFLSKDDEILDREFVKKEAEKHYRIIEIDGGHSVPLSCIDKLIEKINFIKEYEVL